MNFNQVHRFSTRRKSNNMPLKEISIGFTQFISVSNADKSRILSAVSMTHKKIKILFSHMRLTLKRKWLNSIRLYCPLAHHNSKTRPSKQTTRNLMLAKSFSDNTQKCIIYRQSSSKRTERHYSFER